MGAVNSTVNRTTNNLVQTSEVRQTSINDFYQETRSECLAFVSQTISDVTIYIGPGATAGNIEFNQKAEQEASCMLNTQLESLSTTQLESMQAQLGEQTAQTQTDPNIPTSVFGAVMGFTFGIDSTRNYTQNETEQIALTDQTMKNLVTQMITTSCEATTEQLVQNIIVYLAEGATAGDVTFTQEAPQNLNCTILNASVVESTNNATAEQKQTSDQAAKQKSGLVDVIMIIAIVIGVVVIATTALRVFGPKEKEEPVEEYQETSIDSYEL